MQLTYVVVVAGKRVYQSVYKGNAIMWRNALKGASITTDLKNGSVR